MNVTALIKLISYRYRDRKGAGSSERSSADLAIRGRADSGIKRNGSRSIYMLVAQVRRTFGRLLYYYFLSNHCSSFYQSLQSSEIIAHMADLTSSPGPSQADSTVYEVIYLVLATSWFKCTMCYDSCYDICMPLHISVRSISARELARVKKLP